MIQNYVNIIRIVEITSKSLYKECLKLYECIRDLASTSTKWDMKLKIKGFRRSDILYILGNHSNSKLMFGLHKLIEAPVTIDCEL